ncbi:hypothetical protein SDC9_133271 [bioreactor metagenome]|uniref:Uncharacterized protein n=1 Tax=bioreactor metagenome TaxID=1076179 RepID=A0A645D9U8_9ZZZZ
MRRSVIGPAIARRRDRDRFIGVRHRQRAVHLRDAVVARGARRERVALQLIRYGAFAGERDAPFHDRRNRVRPDQACHVVAGIAARGSIIGERSARSLDRHSLWQDRQCARDRRDRVVRRHVFRAVHDLVAIRDPVVAVRGIRHIGHAAGRRRHQGVAREQFACRDRHACVLVRRSVIGPAIASRRDRDRFIGLCHRQRAVQLCDTVVARDARRERIALHFVLYGALAWERDAPFHHRRDRIRPDKAFHTIAGAALLCTCVHELPALRRDRHNLGQDRQCARDRRDCVVRCHVFSAAHDLPAGRDRIVPIRCVLYIGHDPGRRRHQGVAREQFAFCDRHARVLVCRSVISPALARRFDRDRCRSHRRCRRRCRRKCR